MEKTQWQCYAHYNPGANQYQSVYAHSVETAEIIKNKNAVPILTNAAFLAALLHDAGKLSREWQEYFSQSIEKPSSGKGKLDHATAGGQIMEQLLPRSHLSVLVQTAIYSHHGLQDCVDLDNSGFLLDKRQEKAKGSPKPLPIEECRDRFFEQFKQAQIQCLCNDAKQDIDKLLKTIHAKVKGWGNGYGSQSFYLGMFERLLISILMDADRRNTADFMKGAGGIKETGFSISGETIVGIWEGCKNMVERRIGSFSEEGEINRYRKEISDACLKMSKGEGVRYRLTVPTGAGKTLSSLRFAINDALKHQKKRVIYVAPFQSIVEQNAKEIREALGRPEIVLEHHCNIILDEEQEKERYDRFTEDWDMPVIVTTAVQFLNTLFSGKTSCVRRMQSLCDSVVILDEVQAIPVRLVEMFHLAINFLTEFVGASIVLCTATQPVLEELPHNRLLRSDPMVLGAEKYEDKFRRVRIINETTRVPEGMGIRDAANFIIEKAEQYQSVLFIANTKACACEVFKAVVFLREKGYDVRHLSTRMYPKHRQDVLKIIRQNLDEGKCQICISTQLIEAGVNISFPCVIRSLAGIDSVVQAAGRCNRHKENPTGYVFLIKMCEAAEDLKWLKDISLAQQAAYSVLYQFDHQPEIFDYALDSQKAISLYFNYYYEKYIGEMDYPVTERKVPTSLVRLLSDNRDFVAGRKGPILKQAFRTAGERFEAIEDQGRVALVVSYSQEAKKYLTELEDRHLSFEKRKEVLRRLQLYTVQVSANRKRELESGISNVLNGQVMVLDGRFYDEDTGVAGEPKPLPDLFL